MTDTQIFQPQSIRTRSVRTALLLAFAMAAVTGCHKTSSPANPASLGPTSSTPTPAPTATLSGDPLVIDLGQSVVLNWRTTDATAVSIDGIGPVNVNGTQTVSPSTSTNFHLVAKGDGGTVEANVRVTVRVAVAPTVPGETAGAEGSGNMGSDEVFHQNVADIFFDYDSYALRKEGETSATKAAAYLVAHPNIRIVIGGYCDDRVPGLQFHASASSASARKSSSAPTKLRPVGSRTGAPNSRSTASRFALGSCPCIAVGPTPPEV